MKRIYTFGNGKAEGRADMKNLLGGKGANLAEMNLIGVPVPPGFTITTEVCTEYNYVVSGGTLYQITGDWTYTDNYYRGYNPPADTATSRWIFQGVDFDVCGSDCTNHPYVIYRQQVRSGSTVQGGKPSISATCTKVETRSIPTYITRTITETKTILKEPEKPLYGDIHFYREKTCTDVRQASYNYVWSHYNDTNLLGQGYVYTGEYREKK